MSDRKAYFREYDRTRPRRNQEERASYFKEWRKKNIPRTLWASAKRRAKRKGIEFSIEIADIVIPDVCPVFGKPFIIGESVSERRAHPMAPSLDRKDPAKGYVKGNIWVIAWRANDLKSDGSQEEFEAIARAMKTLHSDEE